MGKRCRKPLKHYLCLFTYRRKCGGHFWSCFRKGLCEVYNILNPGPDCRK